MKIRSKYVSIILAAALVLICQGNIKAQEQEAETTKKVKVKGSSEGFFQQLKYGAKVGLGTTNLSVDNFSMLGKPRTALTAGLYAEYEFVPRLSAVLGVDYTQNGGSELDASIFYEKENPMWSTKDIYLYRTDLIMHTLEVPLSVRYALTQADQTGGFSPFISVGGVFGWNFGAKANNFRRQDYAGAPQDKLAESSHYVHGKMSPIMGSAIIGIGTEIKTTQLPFDVEVGVTYRLGLTNLRDYKYSIYDRYSSNTTMFYIGIKFGPGKQLF